MWRRRVHDVHDFCIPRLLPDAESPPQRCIQSGALLIHKQQRTNATARIKNDRTKWPQSVESVSPEIKDHKNTFFEGLFYEFEHEKKLPPRHEPPENRGFIRVSSDAGSLKLFSVCLSVSV